MWRIAHLNSGKNAPSTVDAARGVQRNADTTADFAKLVIFVHS